MSRPIYKPYESDTGTDTDTDTDTTRSTTDTDTSQSDTDSSSVADQRVNYRVLAEGLTMQDLPTADTSGNVPPSDVSGVDAIFPSKGLVTFNKYEFKPDESGANLERATQTITNVIMMDSVDRDTQVFPQPTNLTLRLPRTYKKVTGFSLVQIKLLSAFYYFSATKTTFRSLF